MLTQRLHSLVSDQTYCSRRDQHSSSHFSNNSNGSVSSISRVTIIQNHACDRLMEPAPSSQRALLFLCYKVIYHPWLTHALFPVLVIAMVELELQRCVCVLFYLVNLFKLAAGEKKTSAQIIPFSEGRRLDWIRI